MTLDAHPFADAWPMLSEADLADLADDIRSNGLRDAIVLYGDRILDGRNRYVACQLAEVEPTYEQFAGGDDDALAFVQSVNNARRHQSKGSLAASWALSMLAAGKRQGGRWQYGESRNSDISRDVRAVLGLIADEDPDLLLAVRDDDFSLNAAHESAKAHRASRLAKQEEERLEAEAEADAQRFLEAEASELADQVGTTFESYREAEAIWKIRNAEEARERAERERAERERKAAIERGIKDALGHIGNAVQFIATTDAELFVKDTLPHCERYPNESRYLTADHIDAAIDYLTTIRKAL